MHDCNIRFDAHGQLSPALACSCPRRAFLTFSPHTPTPHTPHLHISRPPHPQTPSRANHKNTRIDDTGTKLPTLGIVWLAWRAACAKSAALCGCHGGLHMRTARHCLVIMGACTREQRGTEQRGAHAIGMAMRVASSRVFLSSNAKFEFELAHVLNGLPPWSVF